MLYLAIGDGPRHILAIKDGPEQVKRLWGTDSKLQVCPGHVQILELFDRFKGLKEAFSYLYYEDLFALRKRLNRSSDLLWILKALKSAKKIDKKVWKPSFT